MATVWLTSAVLAGLSGLWRNGRAQRLTRLAGGSLLIALGAHLALTRE